MTTFRAHLKKTKNPIQSRQRFDLEKLRNPNVAATFQATTGVKFAPLINLRDDDIDIDIDRMITTYNTTVTDTASEILGKERNRKKPSVARHVLDLCDERRDLKKRQYEEEEAIEYRRPQRKRKMTGWPPSARRLMHG